MIAALFVDPEGPYANREGIDVWGEDRDARLYSGPHKVIAHPPCQRWGRYWSGGPSAKVRRELGDDGGCFASAFESAMTWGGVIEHPAYSHAYKRFGLPRPEPKVFTWAKHTYMDKTCFVTHVEQGNYGHAARKATWLIYFGTQKPEDLLWGKAEGKQRLDEGFRSSAARRAARASGIKPRKLLTPKQNIHTPLHFLELLVRITSM